MKNMFKLAAIAVSMALVASLAACSSGDDDVVDTSTPEYLLTEQINRYVASIEYYEYVSDADVESLKTAHEDVMKIIGDCADCLDVYFDSLLKKELGNSGLVGEKKVEEATDGLKYLKKYGTEKAFHKVFVYKERDIKNALLNLVWFVYDDYNKKYVVDTSKQLDIRNAVIEIGKSDSGSKIVDGKLDGKQTKDMKAYTDAAAALKAALSDDDKKTCETTIKAADDAIEAFGKLENKNVTNAEIKKVIDAVDGMCKDIQINIYDKIKYLER